MQNPAIITDRSDIAAIMRARRLELGLSIEQLDAKAGFSDRYTAKLEIGNRDPSGRNAVALNPMGSIWLQTLGLQLVLMTEDDAAAIGAVPAPHRTASPASTTKTPGYRKAEVQSNEREGESARVGAGESNSRTTTDSERA